MIKIWQQAIVNIIVKLTYLLYITLLSGSHACRDCGWHIILVAELYTTCPGERVLVASTCNFSVSSLNVPQRVLVASTC